MKKIKIFRIKLICLSNIVIFAVLLLNSCTKIGPIGPAGPTGPTGPQGPKGSTYLGSVAGYITLYDQYGYPVLSGLSGINIVVDSVGKPIAKTTTDGSGHYFIPKIYTGYYTMAVSNPLTSPSFGNQFGYFGFQADTLQRNVSLSSQANFSPTSVSASYNNTLGVDSLYITVANKDLLTRSVIIFIGNTANVSSSNYLGSKTVSINAGSTVSKISIPAIELAELGIPAGNTVYFAFYGEPVSDKSVYLNPNTGLNVYTALSTTHLIDSTTVATVIP